MKACCKKTIWVALFLTLSILLSAKVQEGLLFRSYDVVSDQRTSLDIPSAGTYLNFKDSLNMSFDVRLELDRGRFGYVCRLFVDGEDPIDLLLSTPQGDGTSLVFTGDHRNMFPIYHSDPILSLWQTMHMRVIDKGGQMHVLVNGKDFYQFRTSQPRHTCSISFGKGNNDKNTTTDVAPMVIRNLRIRTDKRAPYFWAMSDESEVKSGAGLPVQISNPVWLQDYNRKWRKVWSEEMPSTTYICSDTLRGRLWFVADGKVACYQVNTGSWWSRTTSRKMKPGLATNDLVILSDGTLAFADVALLPRYIRFDPEKGDWEQENPRERSSLNLHHNTLFLSCCNKYVYLFGYGQYRYHKTATIWSEASDSVQVMELPGVFPRYLAGAGCYNGLIYVLGGKGNDVGIQELGVRLYDDFFSLDLKDGTVSRIWRSPVMEEEVAVKDLLFSADGSSFLTLTFNPDVYESALQLRRFSMADGHSEALSTPIPFPFLDVASEARLLYDAREENYVAAVACKEPDGVFRVSVYLLGSPLLDATEGHPGHRARSLWWLLPLGLGLCGVLVWVRMRSRRDQTAPQVKPAMTATRQPPVRILGGFRVYSAAGEDITSSFTPQMERFFVLLILHTVEYGGVSNAKLKSLLWSDKSDESYNNNRGVTMKKIRKVLEQVGDIDFVSEGGQWKVSGNTALCDYFVAAEVFQQGSTLEELLEVAAWGPLLPEVQSDYLDPFKSNHTNRVFQGIEHIRQDRGEALTPVQSEQLADCALLFDSLDEEAIRLKCNALIAQKRLGLARQVFSRFAEEYQRVMGEPFSADFKDFIK